MVNAIIFDLDGTLLDREKSLRLFLDDQYERYHEYLSQIQRQDYIQYFIDYDEYGYVSKKHAYEKLFKVFDIQFLRPSDLLKDFMAMYPRFATPFPDTIETLQRLQARGYKMGIITNGSPEHQGEIIDILGIESYMTDVLISGQIGIRKPDLKIFVKMMHDLSEEPADCMFVGDNPENDVAPSHELGMVSVFKDNGHFRKPRPEITSYYIQELEELLSILDEETIS